MSEALNSVQIAFNQRLLAEHCMCEDRAKEVFEELSNHYETNDKFRDSLSSSNAQLQFLGLEIVVMSIPGEEKQTRHFAIVNKFSDKAAKESFQPVLFQPPQQQGFFRVVLEKLVHDGTAPRSTLFNMKNDMNEKITLESAEDALERLIEEKWLVEVDSKHRRGSNACEITMGPRTYCELSDLLTNAFGMDVADLPQQIVL